MNLIGRLIDDSTFDCATIVGFFLTKLIRLPPANLSFVVEEFLFS